MKPKQYPSVPAAEGPPLTGIGWYRRRLAIDLSCHQNEKPTREAEYLVALSRANVSY